MSRAPVLIPLLLASCAEPGLRPASAVGLDVRAGRRHAETSTLFVANMGDRPRRVDVQQVSRVEGPCGGARGQWAEAREEAQALGLRDTDVAEAYEGAVGFATRLGASSS